MLITTKNLKFIQSYLESVKEKILAVSYDCEFGGLYSPYHKSLNLVSNIEEVYSAIKESVKSYSLLQVGFTIFFKEEEKITFTSFCFYPTPTTSIKIERSTTTFLARNKYNFYRNFTNYLQAYSNAPDKLPKNSRATPYKCLGILGRQLTLKQTSLVPQLKALYQKLRKLEALIHSASENRSEPSDSDYIKSIWHSSVLGQDKSPLDFGLLGKELIEILIKQVAASTFKGRENEMAKKYLALSEEELFQFLNTTDASKESDRPGASKETLLTNVFKEKLKKDLNYFAGQVERHVYIFLRGIVDEINTRQASLALPPKKPNTLSNPRLKESTHSEDPSESSTDNFSGGKFIDFELKLSETKDSFALWELSFTFFPPETTQATPMPATDRSRELLKFLLGLSVPHVFHSGGFDLLYIADLLFPLPDDYGGLVEELYALNENLTIFDTKELLCEKPFYGNSSVNKLKERTGCEKFLNLESTFTALEGNNNKSKKLRIEEIVLFLDPETDSVSRKELDPGSEANLEKGSETTEHGNKALENSKAAHDAEYDSEMTGKVFMLIADELEGVEKGREIGRGKDMLERKNRIFLYNSYMSMWINNDLVSRKEWYQRMDGRLVELPLVDASLEEALAWEEKIKEGGLENYAYEIADGKHILVFDAQSSAESFRRFIK